MEHYGGRSFLRWTLREYEWPLREFRRADSKCFERSKSVEFVFAFKCREI